MFTLCNTAKTQCTQRYLPCTFLSWPHKVILLKEIFFLTYWFSFLKTTLKITLKTFCPMTAKQRTYACSLLITVYQLLEGSWEVQKKCKAGQTHVGNICKITRVDTSETLSPTQVFSDFCSLRSRVRKKESWAGEQQTIATAKTCPFFLLQPSYLNKRGFFPPSLALHSTIFLKWILHSVPINFQRHDHMVIKLFWWLQTVSRKQQMAFFLILARIWPYESFVSRPGKHCPDAVIIGCEQNCLKVYLQFSYQPAGMTFQMGSHWDLG